MRTYVRPGSAVVLVVDGEHYEIDDVLVSYDLAGRVILTGTDDTDSLRDLADRTQRRRHAAEEAKR